MTTASAVVNTAEKNLDFIESKYNFFLKDDDPKKWGQLGLTLENIETSLILFAPSSLKTIELFERAFSVATQLLKIS